jgi:hypothetical protein
VRKCDCTTFRNRDLRRVLATIWAVRGWCKIRSMDLWTLRPGDWVRTSDGAVVEIMAETEDGRWIRIRYIEDPENPSVVGTEDLCHEDELAERITRPIQS